MRNFIRSIRGCSLNWRLFLVFAAIIGIKAIVLATDRRPAYFLGDSESYLATATIRWIPTGRSFLYGFFIRRVSFYSHSLELLVFVQAFLSAAAAWLLCFALVTIFRVRFLVAAIFGILCAIEPLQLMMERYVMTETCANFLFVVHFVLALFYVRKGRLWCLLLSQGVGVLLIGFRISFLPVVLVDSVLCPVLARRVRRLPQGAKDCGDHEWRRLLRRSWPLLTPFVCSLFLTGGLIRFYEHWYGRLEHREPALLYENGAFLIADFAPLVEKGDFPSGVPADKILDSLRMDRHDPTTRPGQRFLEGGIVRSIELAYPNPKRQNDIETATALHALFRQPAAAGYLAYRTFRSYFDGAKLRGALLVDEGNEQRLTATMRNWLANVYNVTNPAGYEPSPTKTWHLLSVPWYWFILCVLCLSPLTLFLLHRWDLPAGVLCVVTAVIFLEGATLTVDRATPRFLTTDAWLVLFISGVAFDCVVRNVSVFSRRISSPANFALR